MKKNLILLLLLAFTVSAYAQKKTNWLSVETNTTPLIFGGYAIAVNIKPTERWGLLVGTAGNADFPDWITEVVKPQNRNRGIDWEVHRAYVFAVDHYLQPDQSEGWYVGWFNFFFNNQLRKEEQQERFYSHTILGRSGYRWYPATQTRFYLNPWVGIGTEYRLSGSNRVAATDWEMSSFAYFASLNAGFTF